MSSPRRPKSNRRVPARRPRVAGLRKREQAAAVQRKQSSGRTGNPDPRTTAEDQSTGLATVEVEADSAPREAEPAEQPATGGGAEAADDSAGAEEASADERAEPDGTAERDERSGAAEPEAEAPGDDRREGPDNREEPDGAEADRSAGGGTGAETAAESEADDGDTAADGAEEGEVEDGEDRSAPRRRRKPLIATLLVAAVVCAGLAGWFGYENYRLRYLGPAANQSLIDVAATSEVNGQVSEAMERLFSYDFNDTAKTERAAKEILVGSAVEKYDDLFRVVREQAPEQQLVVTTTVRSSAVTWLQGNRAEVLLFVDQHAMRSTTGESTVGPAQVTVGAVKQDGKWKIDRIVLR